MSIPTAYDPILVGLSILIAVLASYTALDLGGRIRIATGWPSRAWIAAASVAMGGGPGSKLPSFGAECDAA